MRPVGPGKWTDKMRPVSRKAVCERRAWTELTQDYDKAGDYKHCKQFGFINPKFISQLCVYKL